MKTLSILFFVLVSTISHAQNFQECIEVKFSNPTDCKSVGAVLDFKKCNVSIQTLRTKKVCTDQGAIFTAKSNKLGKEFEVLAQVDSGAWGKNEWKVQKITAEDTNRPQPKVAEKKEEPKQAEVSIPVIVKSEEVVKEVPEFSISGHARVRYEKSDRTDFSSTKNFGQLRIRPTFLWKPRKDTQVLFEPQASRYFGQNLNSDSSSTYSTAQTSGTTSDPTLYLHQGYLQYSPWEEGVWKAGRQKLSFGDELILGGLEWNNTGRVFDSVLYQQNIDQHKLNFFTSKLIDTNISSQGTGDKDLHGVYAQLQVAEWMKELDLYFLFQNDSNQASTVQQIKTVGLRMKSNIGDMFFYRSETTKQWSKLLGTRAYQSELELGLQTKSSTKLKFSLTQSFAGQDYQSLYPTAHKFLGFADVFGRRNINASSLNVSLQPLSRVTLRYDFFYFKRLSTASPAYKLNGTTSLGTATGSPSKDLGFENDLTVSIKVNDVSNFVLGYSLFSPSIYFKDQFEDESPEFAYAQYQITF